MLVELNNKQETNGQDDFQSSALLELTNLTYQRKTLWTSNHQLNIIIKNITNFRQWNNLLHRALCKWYNGCRHLTRIGSSTTAQIYLLSTEAERALNVIKPNIHGKKMKTNRCSIDFHATQIQCFSFLSAVASIRFFPFPFGSPHWFCFFRFSKCWGVSLKATCHYLLIG